MDKLTQHKLDNGLTVVHLHVPRALVGHFGVAVRAGSSGETDASQFGLAHFVEHTLFKGTAKRSSWHIINRMESVGGELNAFTTKEDTVVYTTFPRGSVRRAVELVTDLILNSRFPAKEIDKEREVICDEINSYRDTPADAVYDDFEDLLYAGHPLGHNILGTIDSVRDITGEMCRTWLNTHYVASNMVVFYAGAASADSFLRTASPYINMIPADQPKKPKVPVFSTVAKFEKTHITDSHQAHTVLGCALPKPDLHQRINLALLTNMLGGPGMNSLLNVSLRERRGLVYTVESSLSNMTDTTMFTTYFGTDPEDNARCIGLVCDEIDRLSQHGISPRRLAAAKKQYRGQLLVARDNIESRIIGVARSLLLHGYTISLSETDALLASITPATIARAASAIHANLSYLTFTPL